MAVSDEEKCFHAFVLLNFVFFTFSNPCASAIGDNAKKESHEIANAKFTSNQLWRGNCIVT